MQVNVIAIANDRDYRRAKALASRLMGARGRADVIRLEAQVALIAEWEQKRYPARKPDPIEALRFRLEQLGLGQKDLARILGSPPRASEILSRRRRLTLSMIRKLRSSLAISADSLVG
jgi:HTH-type transcriptional regulator/antitoxin HigA